MKSVTLVKSKHDRQRFDCGVDALNNYLRLMANQQSVRDNTRTYILEDESVHNHIIGYYTLTIIPLDLGSLPSRLQKKHQNARAGGLVARLAVDKRYSGKGYGEWLLIAALTKLMSVSETVGFPVVIVDAKDGSTLFYQKFGFREFRDTPGKLFVTISNIRKNLLQNSD
jgi:GNAT superfamily N-acetyltransferase